MSEEVVSIPLDVIAKIAAKSDWDTFRVLSRHCMQSVLRSKRMAIDALVHPTPEKLAEIEKTYQDDLNHFKSIAYKYIYKTLKDLVLIRDGHSMAFLHDGVWYFVHVDGSDMGIYGQEVVADSEGMRRMSLVGSRTDAQVWLPVLERYLDFIETQIAGYQEDGNINETQIWQMHRVRFASIMNQIRKLTMMGPVRVGDRSSQGSGGARRRGGMRK